MLPNEPEQFSTEESGLTTAEAQKRLEQFGENTISEVKTPPVVLLLKKFWGIVPWMLEISIILDLVIAKWSDAFLVAALLIFQAILGFYQEQNGKRAVLLLKQKLSVFAHVKRDKKWQTLSAAKVVIGDYIHLQAGNIVPADIKVTRGDVSVDQSQLTGESMPVDMSIGKTLYTGSLIAQGEVYGEVVAIGDKTYYGKTASLIRLAEKPPLLQRLAMSISKYLLIVDLILATVAIVVMSISGMSFFSILTFVLMLLILSVPVALPAMSTLSATIGTSALAKMGVLTARLSAVEDAAAIDILCIDKTGTLTENKPKVEKVVSLSSYSENEIIYLAARTVDTSSREQLNLALVDSAKEKELLNDLSLDKQTRYEAFDPKTKSSGAWIWEENKELHVVKGEPLSIVKLSGTGWSSIEDKVADLSQSGDRVVAVAIEHNSKIDLIGLISLTDPVRSDSAELISLLENKGIRVVLLTGDGKNTAESIATKVNIKGQTAPDDTNYETILPDDAEKYSVFPRVLPQDKYWIVQAFQKAGHVVAMTGDGVNDAPALRQASVGIATSNATDVAKSAAGLILTQPGLTNIPAMIMVSRSIHQRMRTWLLAMVTRKAAIPSFITLGLLFFKEPVITPVLAFMFMILGDIVTFSLSKDNVIPDEKPAPWNIKQLVTYGSIYAVVMFLMSIALYWYAREVKGLTLPQTQTIVFVWLVLVAGQAALYLVRAKDVFWNKPYPGQWFVISTVFTVILAVTMSTFGLLMQPISIAWFGELAILAFSYILVGNILLWLYKLVIGIDKNEKFKLSS